MTDQTYAERYHATERIGGGGMAEVYKATDSVLGRTVAIKVLHQQFASEAGFVARFRQEAQAAANLGHPNIVNIYDWGEQGGTYFIVMEYIEGKNLKEVINAQGALSARKTMEIGTQVCSALEFAHRHEVIHRDIKPHNIVLTPSGEIKVTDFGIARVRSSGMTQTGSILGTAQYVSPEQAQGRAVGAASDIYSLGIVMYEMLTGDPPFSGENPVAVAVKQVNEQPVPPRRINSAIPEELEKVVLRAMAKRPEDRYASAEDMREDILRVQQGLPATAPAPTPDAEKTTVMAPTPAPVPASTRPPEKPKKKPKWPWVLLVIGLAILAGVALWGISALLVPQTAQVPNVVGRTKADARDLLSQKDLKMTATEAYNKDVEKGHVVSQDPEAGATVAKNSTVKVVISKGAQLAGVPNVADMPYEDAVTQIESAGLTVGDVTREYNPDIAEDLVIRQDPAPGTKLPKGEGVDLVISKGTQTVSVPNVVGKTQSQARTTLGNAGLKVSTKTQASTEEPAGVVLSQDPGAGTEVPINSTVSIVVSSGPPMVTVPNVVGKSEAAATNLLQGAGFTVQVEYVPDPSTNVVLQSPASGTKARQGSKVNISVGDGSGP